MFFSLWFAPGLICLTLVATTFGLIGRRLKKSKSSGKAKNSQEFAVNLQDDKDNKLVKGKARSKDKNRDKIAKKAEKEKAKGVVMPKIAPQEKPKKKEKINNVSNNKSKGSIAIVNSNAKAYFDASDSALREAFRQSMDTYNSVTKHNVDRPASMAVTYSDGSVKNDTFVAPESVIRDDMMPFLFESTKDEERYPQKISLIIGGKSYDFDFDSKEKAQKFYEEQYATVREGNLEVANNLDRNR